MIQKEPKPLDSLKQEKAYNPAKYSSAFEADETVDNTAFPIHSVDSSSGSQRGLKNKTKQNPRTPVKPKTAKRQLEVDKTLLQPTKSSIESSEDKHKPAKNELSFAEQMKEDDDAMLKESSINIDQIISTLDRMIEITDDPSSPTNNVSGDVFNEDQDTGVSWGSLTEPSSVGKSIGFEFGYASGKPKSLAERVLAKGERSSSATSSKSVSKLVSNSADIVQRHSSKPPTPTAAELSRPPTAQTPQPAEEEHLGSTVVALAAEGSPETLDPVVRKSFTDFAESFSERFPVHATSPTFETQKQKIPGVLFVEPKANKGGNSGKSEVAGTKDIAHSELGASGDVQKSSNSVAFSKRQPIHQDSEASLESFGAPESQIPGSEGNEHGLATATQPKRNGARQAVGARPEKLQDQQDVEESLRPVIGNPGIASSDDITAHMSRLADVAAAAELDIPNDLDGEETLELVYDPETNSYFDPATGKYYDIEPDTDEEA
ncbi:hypothetical protein HDV05_007501 [Chytridiales sp. JEL 0842]|nr:hypothetical protein HDV05_007501 [Chytridiales sp. JEL 0842]